MTREEFKKTIERIFEQEGANVSDERFCDDISCKSCPLGVKKLACVSSVHGVNLIFNTLEFVEKWAKEHPIVTRANKYKEVLGVEPIRNRAGDLICPLDAGFIDFECGDYSSCDDCRNKFWNSECIEEKQRVTHEN